MRRRHLLLPLLVLILVTAVAARPAAAGDSTPLPVPRYVSLRADKINLRTGPGLNFPVQWVYQRRHMPVEVIAEYDTWRKIRDWQGTVGWVHESMLQSSRYALITGGERILRREPSETAAAAARVMPGVIGELLKCQGAWCRLDVHGYRGWLKRDRFYGVYPAETVK